MIQLSKEDELFHKRTGQWGGIYLSDNPLIERKLDDYKKEALDMLRRIGFDGVELKFINSQILVTRQKKYQKSCIIQELLTPSNY